MEADIKEMQEDMMELARKNLGKRIKHLSHKKGILFKVWRVRRLAKALGIVKDAVGA